MPRPVLAFLAVALAAAAMLAGDAPNRIASADEPDVNEAISQQQRMEAELAQQRAQLDSLREQQESLTGSLARLTGDLERVGAELAVARERLDELTASLETTRRALAGYRAQIVSHEAVLARIAVEIEEAKADLATREALLQEHLRAAYEQSRVTVLEILLSADTFSEASGQLGYLLTLSDEDRQLAHDIEQSRQRLEVKQETLRASRETLGQLEADAARREAELALQQAQADEARALLERKELELEQVRAAQEQQLAQTAANATAQADLVAAHERALDGHRILVEQLKERARELDIAYHGRFAWPYGGSSWVVTQEFGHTSFDHAHTGIDLSYTTPVCSGPVYAAADGTVLADGQPNAAHGDSAIGVVIGHSQRLQSWYWHLSSEVVWPGQQVRAGELIGYEGATGLATGCHLHLQVMFDEQPVNPRNYLP